MNVHFGSDAHFGHANIIKFDNRPFPDIVTHDKALINNWNAQVDDKDEVWYLGDFGMRSSGGYLEGIMRQLKGKLNFVAGNHDKSNIIKLYERYGTYHGNLTEWTHPEKGQHIVLCHYAMRVWNQSHRGAWHLYGHSHGSLPEDPCSLSFDVGLNTNNYRLYSWNEIEARMRNKEKNYKPVDHHEPRQSFRHVKTRV